MATRKPRVERYTRLRARFFPKFLDPKDLCEEAGKPASPFDCKFFEKPALRTVVPRGQHPVPRGLLGNVFLRNSPVAQIDLDCSRYGIYTWSVTGLFRGACFVRPGGPAHRRNES